MINDGNGHFQDCSDRQIDRNHGQEHRHIEARCKGDLSRACEILQRDEAHNRCGLEREQQFVAE